MIERWLRSPSCQPVDSSRFPFSRLLFARSIENSAVDEMTPPSKAFAVFINLAGVGRIEVYEFNGHEGGGSVHFEKQVGFVREHLR